MIRKDSVLLKVFYLAYNGFASLFQFKEKGGFATIPI